MSKYTAEQVIYAADLEQARYDGDLTISEYLRDYAALLRERESAKAAVTDEIFEAFDAAQTKAMGEYEMQQYHAGKESHLVNALDFATRAALEAVAPMLASARVPDGWQLVPVEPSVEMIDAGLCGCMDNDVTVCVYKSMLAAAPKPEKEG